MGDYWRYYVSEFTINAFIDCKARSNATHINKGIQYIFQIHRGGSLMMLWGSKLSELTHQICRYRLQLLGLTKRLHISMCELILYLPINDSYET